MCSSSCSMGMDGFKLATDWLLRKRKPKVKGQWKRRLLLLLFCSVCGLHRPTYPPMTHPPTQSNTLYRIGVQIWYNSIICIYFAYDSKWESSFPWTIFLVSIETRLVLQNGFFWTETLCLFFLFGFYMT